MEIDLKGQVILVTGASAGIGEAIARSLASSNATVAIHYNTHYDTAYKLENEFGNDSKAFHANLENSYECYNLFEKVIAYYGKIDTLINNAGIFVYSSLQDDSWDEVWEKTMNINLNATAILSRQAIRLFMNNGGGRIINIASRAAFRGDTEDYLAYAASKGAMVAFTRSIARSFGKHNIKAFIVAPGFTRTKMAEDFIAIHGEERLLNEIALNQLTKPEDIAPTVLFLTSGLMDHATGCTIDINAASYVR